MDGCPDVTEIADLVAGTAGAATDRLQDHLDGCSECFELVAELVRDPDRAGVTEPPATGWRETRQLAEYRLVRPIGRGSSGQVWLAEDTQLARMVAIKFVSVATRASARERFQIEARAIARMSHPNVVTVYRVGEIEDQLYLVSELVRGKSLDLVDTPLPSARVLEIGLGLARGLAAAHAAGIVHRDIKPANAILGDRGEIKLLDFGLAKLDAETAFATTSGQHDPDASPDLTATGHLLGTPLYMAPEAWLGTPPTTAMDVFSLGAVLYELCTGAPPHRGPTLAAVRRSALGPPPATIATIDPRLAAIIARCLAREPGDRYASGESLCAALELASRPVPPRRISRRWVGLAALGVIAIAGATTVGLASRASTPRHAVVAPVEPQRCSPDRWCWDASWIGRFDGVWGAAANDIWAVGERGVVRHFDGRAWQATTAGTDGDLVGIGGTARDDIWSVGAHGTIVHWDGRAWRGVLSNTHVTLYAIAAIARDDAWAGGVDGAILHWDGATWTAVASDTPRSIFQIAARAANDVWAVGNHTIVHWDGARWTAFDPDTPELVTGVFIAAADDVWAVGFHSVIRHWDGHAWSRYPVPEVADPDPARREDFPFNAVGGTGPDDVWLMSKWGAPLHWDGHAWTRHPRGTGRELGKIIAFARDDAWAVGATAAIVHWDGHAWQPTTPDPTYREMRALWSRAPDDVWAAGFAGIDWRRSGGAVVHWDGRAWHDLAVPETRLLNAVSGSASDIYFASEDGSIVHWDGARARVEPSSTTHPLRGIWAATAHPWAVGEGGAIVHRTGGAWAAVPSGTTADLDAIWGTADDDVWAAGDLGTLLHWQGARWTQIASTTTAPLHALWGTSARDVWAVGEAGVALRWDGSAWATVFTNADLPLRAISGSGPDDVWATSNADSGVPTILHWNGTAWAVTERTTPVPFWGLVAVGPDEAWTVGSANTFLHHVPVER